MNTEQDLLKKVKRHPEDSVDKCKDILQLVKTLVNSNPAEAVKWCIKGLEISKKIGYAEGASFNDSIGIANVYAGSFFDALKYFNIALQYYDQKLKRKLEQEDEIFTLGIVFPTKANDGFSQCPAAGFEHSSVISNWSRK